MEVDVDLDGDTPTRGGVSRSEIEAAQQRAAPSQPPTAPGRPRARSGSTVSSSERAVLGSGSGPRSVNRSGGGSGASAASAVTSPREALLLSEIRRLHTLAIVTVALVAFVIASLFVLPADPFARAVHAAGIVPTGVFAAWLALVLRDETRFRPWMAVIFAGLCGTAMASAFFFWGVFSSGVVVVPIIMYVFAQGSSRGPVIAAFLGSVVPHALLGLLIVSGVTVDRGVIRPVDLDPMQALVVLAIAQFVFAIAYVLARMHRRSTEESMERLEAAARHVAQREALLLEARQELDRALKVGGPGRFSEQVVGSYRLGNVLGRGAMGEVYEASHVETGAPAAIKLLSAGAAQNDQIVTRFLREVKIAAALDVPNVVRVLETPADASSGLPFLAMERLAGQTLADLLRERGRLPLSEACTMIGELCTGLAAAHAAGVVHRDLKPQNVFLHREAGDKIWKILDFGVSRLAGEGTLTHDQLVGTPTYMPPEQAEGKEVDHRADLYALGCVAYRAITGRPAYSGSDAAAILFKVTTTLPPSPSSAVPSLPSAVDRVLAVAMAKTPETRFQTAAEMVDAFRALARGDCSREIDTRAAAALAHCPWGGAVVTLRRVEDGGRRG